LIRDQYGKKMSKSRGNTVDPLALIEGYGADALRLTIARGAHPGADMALSEQWVAGSRNFATKLWNAARFALAHGADPDGEIDPALLTDADRWVLDRVSAVNTEVDTLLEGFQFARATELLYHFTWDEFCDWYLELAKAQLGESPRRATNTRAVLGTVLDVLLRLLHPVMPFITEALWTALTGKESLVVASWPRLNPQAEGPDPAVTERVTATQKLVTEVRRFRADQGLRDGQWVPARLAGIAEAGLGAQLTAVRALARLGTEEDSFTVTATLQVGLPGGSVRVELDTSGSIDMAAERARLGKDLAAASKELSNAEAKLGNPKFTERAPANIVSGIHTRRDTAHADIDRIQAALDALPEA
jgi:valyl-tRNA synthetase